MFRRKTAPAALGLILGSGLCLMAQQPQTSTTSPQPDPVQRQERFRRMKGHRQGMKPSRFNFGLHELNLTNEQKQQTQAILQRHLDGIKAQREELLQLGEKRMTNTLTADGERARELRQQIRESRQGIQGEIGSVLTADQRAQMEQLQNQRNERREEIRSRRQQFRKQNPQ